MAKMSSINKNNKRVKLSNKFYKKRKNLKKIIMNKNLTLEERFKAQQKLSKLPRNSAKIRGLDITISIKTQNKEHSYELLKQINFPFLVRKDN